MMQDACYQHPGQVLAGTTSIQLQSPRVYFSVVNALLTFCLSISILPIQGPSCVIVKYLRGWPRRDGMPGAWLGLKLFSLYIDMDEYIMTLANNIGTFIYLYLYSCPIFFIGENHG